MYALVFVLSQQLKSCRLQKKHSPQAIGKRHHHPVADLHFALVDVRADLFDDAHRLVAEHVAGLHERNKPVHEVEVGTADAGRGNFNDSVPAVEDLRVGDPFDRNLVGGAPD